MARVVPNNPLAFPPSMEVSVGGRATQEQLPRTPVSSATQDAYMDVSGRTAQETKSSSCRGAEALPGENG